MMRFVREFRLIPVVLLAITCLLGLKVLGLVLDGGYTLADLDFRGTGAAASKSDDDPASAAHAHATVAADTAARGKASWAQEMFNFPDVTGSIETAQKTPDNGKKEGETASGLAAPAKPAEKKPDGKVIELDAKGPASPAERAILERLSARRQELDARQRELEIRENMLKSAEQRLEARMNELKELEARVNDALRKKDEAETVKLKSLVTMYENMKAKDAAKIFDRLDLKILVEVVSQINPRRMADILAQMQPEAAERLTVELATRANAAERKPSVNDLPKIEGRPPS